MTTAILRLLVASVALFALSGCIRDNGYTLRGGEFDPPEQAAPIELTDQFGNGFSLSDLEGEVALIYFGYTTCPDLCPTTLSDFSYVKDQLGDDAERVKFLFVTVDPERDTADRINQYLAFFDPEFVGLYGSETEIESVKSAYGVVSEKVEYPDSATGYLVDHTSLVYVIDTDGNLRLTYPYGFDPDLIVEDVEHLL